MSFSKTLFTLGGTKFPLKWIYRESYHVTPHVLDLDSTRATTGELQRNVLDLVPCTIQWQTPPLSFDEYEEMWSFIRSAYVDDKERKVSCKYYSFETGGMEPIGYGGFGYIPDVEHSPYTINNDKKMMLSSTIEIIGY